MYHLAVYFWANLIKSPYLPLSKVSVIAPWYLPSIPYRRLRYFEEVQACVGPTDVGTKEHRLPRISTSWNWRVSTTVRKGFHHVWSCLIQNHSKEKMTNNSTPCKSMYNCLFWCFQGHWTSHGFGDGTHKSFSKSYQISSVLCHCS